jgi:hypothetical protein
LRSERTPETNTRQQFVDNRIDLARRSLPFHERKPPPPLR